MSEIKTNNKFNFSKKFHKPAKFSTSTFTEPQWPKIIINITRRKAIFLLLFAPAILNFIVDQSNFYA